MCIRDRFSFGGVCEGFAVVEAAAWECEHWLFDAVVELADEDELVFGRECDDVDEVFVEDAEEGVRDVGGGVCACALFDLPAWCFEGDGAVGDVPGVRVVGLIVWR